MTKDSSDTNEAGTTTRNDANILPRVLAVLVLAMVVIVEFGDSFAKGSDTSSRPIFTRVDGNVKSVGSLKTSLYVIFNFWSALA
jgi:hypothetical protein